MPLLELSEKTLTKKELANKEELRQKLQKGLSGEDMLQSDWDKIKKDTIFFEQQEISLPILSKYWDTLTPSQRKMISRNLNIDFTEEFVKIHADSLDFEMLTRREELLTEDFFEQYGERLDWEYLGQHSELVPQSAQEKYANLLEYGQKGYPLFAIKLLNTLNNANQDIINLGGDRLYDMPAIENSVLQITMAAEIFRNSSTTENLERAVNLVEDLLSKVKDESKTIVSSFAETQKQNIKNFMNTIDEKINNIFSEALSTSEEERENGSDSRASMEAQETADTSKASSSETPFRESMNRAIENPENHTEFLNNFSKLIPWKGIKTSLFATYFVSGKEHLINWEEISKEKLPINFIKKYQNREDFDVVNALINNDYSARDCNKFNWNTIDLAAINSGIFIRKYGDRLDLSNFNWDQIQDIEEIGAEWFENNAENINAEELATFDNIDLDIVNALSTNIGFAEAFDYVRYFNEHDISPEFLDTYAGYIDWNKLSSSPKLTVDMVKKYYKRLNLEVVQSNPAIPEDFAETLQDDIDTVKQAHLTFIREESQYKNIESYKRAILDAFTQGIDVTSVMSKDRTYTPEQINSLMVGIQEGLSREQLETISMFGNSDEKSQILLQAAVDGMEIEKMKLDPIFSADRLRETIQSYEGTADIARLSANATKEEKNLYSMLYQGGCSSQQAKFAVDNHKEIKDIISKIKDYSVPQLEQYLTAKLIDGIDLTELMNSNLTAEQMKLYVNLASKDLINDQYGVDFIKGLTPRKIDALNDLFTQNKFKESFLTQNVSTIEAEIPKRSYAGKLFDRLSHSISRSNYFGASIINGIAHLISGETPEQRAKKEQEKEEQTEKETEEKIKEQQTQEKKEEQKQQQESTEKEEKAQEEQEVQEKQAEETSQQQNEIEEQIEEVVEETANPEKAEEAKTPEEKESDIIEDPDENSPVVTEGPETEESVMENPMDVTPIVVDDDEVIKSDTEEFAEAVNDSEQSARNNTEALNPQPTHDLKWATEVVRGTIISNNEFLSLYENGELKNKLLEDKHQLEEVRAFIQNDPDLSKRIDLRTLNSLIKEKEGQLRTLGVVEKMDLTPNEEPDVQPQEPDMSQYKYIKIDLNGKKDRVYIIDADKGVLSYKGVEFTVNNDEFGGILSGLESDENILTPILTNDKAFKTICKELELNKTLTAEEFIKKIHDSGLFGDEIKVSTSKKSPDEFYINTYKNGKPSPSILITPEKVVMTRIKDLSKEEQAKYKDFAKYLGLRLKKVNSLEDFKKEIEPVLLNKETEPEIKTPEEEPKPIIEPTSEEMPTQETDSEEITQSNAQKGIDDESTNAVTEESIDAEEAETIEEIDLTAEKSVDTENIGENVNTTEVESVEQSIEIFIPDDVEKYFEETGKQVTIIAKNGKDDSVRFTAFENGNVEVAYSSGMLDTQIILPITLENVTPENLDVLSSFAANYAINLFDIAQGVTIKDWSNDKEQIFAAALDNCEVPAELQQSEESITDTDISFDNLKQEILDDGNIKLSNSEIEFIVEPDTHSIINGNRIIDGLPMEFTEQDITACDKYLYDNPSIFDVEKETIPDVEPVEKASKTTEIQSDDKKSKEELKKELAQEEIKKYQTQEVVTPENEPKTKASDSFSKHPEYVDKAKVEKTLRYIPYTNRDGKQQKPNEFFNELKEKCRNLSAEEQSKQNSRSTHGMFRLNMPNINVTTSTISVIGRSTDANDKCVFNFNAKTNMFENAEINGQVITDISELSATLQHDILDFTNYLAVHNIEKEMLVSSVLQSDLLVQLSKLNPEMFGNITKTSNFNIKPEMVNESAQLTLSNDALTIVIDESGTILSGGDNLTPEAKSLISNFMKDNSEMLFAGVKDIQSQIESEKTMSAEARQLLSNEEMSVIGDKIEAARQVSMDCAKKIIEEVLKKEGNPQLQSDTTRKAKELKTKIEVKIEKELSKLFKSSSCIQIADKKALGFFASPVVSLVKPKGASSFEFQVTSGCEVKMAKNVEDMSKLTPEAFEEVVSKDVVIEQNKKKGPIIQSITADDVKKMVEEYDKGIEQHIAGQQREDLTKGPRENDGLR